MREERMESFDRLRIPILALGWLHLVSIDGLGRG